MSLRRRLPISPSEVRAKAVGERRRVLRKISADRAARARMPARIERKKTEWWETDIRRADIARANTTGMKSQREGRVMSPSAARVT